MFSSVVSRGGRKENVYWMFVYVFSKNVSVFIVTVVPGDVAGIKISANDELGCGVKLS